MGEGLEVGVECRLGALNRVIDRILRSDVPLRRVELEAAAAAAAALEAPLASRRVADDAVATLVGMGPIEPLLADPAVSDVLVNGPDEVWVERDGILQRTDVTFPGPEAVVAAVERALIPLGLRLDRASPAVDARLPDGSWLHAMVPPASVDGPVVAIRRFTAAVVTMNDLVEAGAIDREGVRLLEDAVVGRSNILVSGATGSGKTTLLNLLSRAIPADERTVTIEEAAELGLDGHVVRLEARPPNAEGAGEITMRSLVRHALRMRPDRIVVGEVRGPEALDLIQAMSTGHSGSMGTVHAPGAAAAMWRVETLAATAGGVPHDALRRMLWTAIDVVIHMERSQGARRVVSICSVSEGDVEVLWSR